MRLRRRWWAALAAGALLIGGCATSTSGSPERASSVSDETTSMTPPSGESPTVDETEVSTTAPEPATESSDAATASSDVPPATSQPAEVETAAPEPDACAETATWTTSVKSVELRGNAQIRDVRADVDDCFDAFTIEIGPDAHDPGYVVQYVDDITQDGSGFVVPVAGEAKLQVIVDSAAYDPSTGAGTLQIPDHDHVVDVADLAVVKQVAYAGSFEGQTTFGIGVAAELPFAVTTGFDNAGNATLTVAVAHD